MLLAVILKEIWKSTPFTTYYSTFKCWNKRPC